MYLKRRRERSERYVVYQSEQAPHRNGGTVRRFACKVEYPKPFTTSGRKILNAIPGTEEVMLQTRSHQTRQSVIASVMSCFLRPGSPPIIALPSPLVLLLCRRFAPSSSDSFSARSSSPSSSSSGTFSACARSIKTRFSAQARSAGVLSHQAFFGPVGSQKKAVNATIMVRPASRRKRIW